MDLHRNMASIRSIKTVSELQPGSHACCFFETEEEHRVLMKSFMRQGLERNEKVIYIVDARSPNEVINYLRDDGGETESHLESGQLIILEVDQTYMREGFFDPEHQHRYLARTSSEGLGITQGDDPAHVLPTGAAFKDANDFVALPGHIHRLTNLLLVGLGYDAAKDDLMVAGQAFTLNDLEVLDCVFIWCIAKEE